MRYRYQAMTSSGAIVEDTIDADSRDEAADALRRQGSMLMQLVAESPSPAAAVVVDAAQRMKERELLLFTRQMKMLLESGSALVTALEAIERQTQRPAAQALIRQVREHVERGGTLSEALAAHPRTFSPVYCSLVGAGEATATLPDVFSRLSDLLQRQQAARKALLGAMAYPAFLTVLSIVVMVVLLTFVVPRFRMLFENLNRPLPYTTVLMFDISSALLTYWPVLVGAFVAVVVGIVLAFRTPWVRNRMWMLLFDVPLLGRVLARFELVRVLRVWSAMLRSNVALLDTIVQSKLAITNPVFRDVLDQLQDSVSAGGHVGDALARARHVDPVIASAVATGEENGRLADAVTFVTEWMDDDNVQLLATLTRIAEPALLALMGLAVGCVSATLFMPLFDMATM